MYRSGIYRGMATRYAHTNLIARNWWRVAKFYRDVIIEIQNWRRADS